MSSSETRRHLSSINESLRAEHNNLKSNKDSLIDHLETLLKRQKQLAELKVQLEQELTRVITQVSIQKNQKVGIIAFMKGELLQLDQTLLAENIHLKNLEQEYQHSLEQYDAILIKISKIIESSTNLENQLTKQNQFNQTIRTMIYDCQRLKRVLEDQKNYFKQLSGAQEKSHAQRVSELEAIKNKLIREDKASTESSKVTHLRLGFLKMFSLFKNTIKKHAESFIRHQVMEAKRVTLYIKIFQSCIKIGERQSKKNVKGFFTQWHNNIFPKQTLYKMVENSLKINLEQKAKLRIWNKISEQTNKSNLFLLHLYEKIKYLSVTMNVSARKNIHIGFNRWRSNVSRILEYKNGLEIVMMKTIPRHHLRNYFAKWQQNGHQLKQFEAASLLLEDYEKTKEIARIFRKWRINTISYEWNSLNLWMLHMKQYRKIVSRINYEKRKVKLLTFFSLKMQKIQLRNYFSKYWNNVQSLYRVKQLQKSINENKDEFSLTKNENAVIKANFAKKDKTILIKIFQSFIYKNKVLPYYKQWKNQSLLFNKQKRALFSLFLRKESKVKLTVMNQFRKCVQYYQKKEMHQVLTDLNRKMEEINQKSTSFREQLKACIQNLGIVASNKIQYIMTYAENFQKRIFFDQRLTELIKKGYRSYLLNRSFIILNQSCLRLNFSSLVEFSKESKIEKALALREQKYSIKKKIDLIKKIFKWWSKRSISFKKGFKCTIHIENVLIFYRLTYAFAAIKRKYVAEDVKLAKKQLIDTIGILENKKENYCTLDQTKQTLQASLKKVFSKFVQYEDRAQNIKNLHHKTNILSIYFSKYKEKIDSAKYQENMLINFNEVLKYKNLCIFWKGLLVTKYEQLKEKLKDELGKINKKKKNFDEKASKTRIDIEKKMEEERKVYETHMQYCRYYIKKYQDLIVYFQRKHSHTQNMYYKRQLFNAWKCEHFAVQKMLKVLTIIFKRKEVTVPLEKVVFEFKKSDNYIKSFQMLEKISDRTDVLKIREAYSIWRCNVKLLECKRIQKNLDGMEQYEANIKSQLNERAELISRQVIRVNAKKLIINVFMAFKKVWQETKNNKRKVLPLQTKIKERRKRDAFKNWNWRTYYRVTKHTYLPFKKQKYQTELKRDVFLALKVYRQEIYTLNSKMSGFYDKLEVKIVQYSFDKVRNVAAHEKDELNEARRRVLFSLVKQKECRIEVIKKKVLWKWNAWLIQKSHYLCSSLKRMELNVLKKAFANINERKYWNDYYIKSIADEVTSTGYGDVNSVTNSLMREGYDPDQIKQYLTKRNSEDNNIVLKVIKHINVWTGKQDLVRAFHSWKQYLMLKRNIKSSLNKVFNIAGGLGKYWSRWRTQDVAFNQILKKESRSNMLVRYQNLSRLLKEYKRDIKDSLINLDQLKEINVQYLEKNKVGKMMALTAISNSVKKGIRQGFYIWKDKAQALKRKMLDERCDQLARGTSVLSDQRQKLKYRIAFLKEENMQLKEKCQWGMQCGKILEKLLTEKDAMSVDLADKEHNLKLLLEDNLRLKQKMKVAQSHAERLIQKVKQEA